MAWAMKASKSNGEGGFEKAPPGNHPARLVAMIDLGTHWQDGYQGAAGKHQHRLYFVYELVTKKMSGKVDTNHVIAIDLTLSMNEKAKMRKWVESRLGRKLADNEVYDIADELGQPVLLNVQMKGEYPKIEGVGAVPDGFQVPDPQNKPVAWQLGDDPAALPSWLPYLYGRAIPDVIADSEEMKNGDYPPPGVAGPQTRATVAQQPQQAARPAVRRPGPAPKVDLSSTATWYVWDDEQKDWGPLSLNEIVAWYNEARVDPSAVRVYPEGGSPELAKTAAEWGFPAMNPF